MIVFIGVLILLVVFLLVCIYFYLNNQFVTKKYNNNNCISGGVKGSGKDLLTQLVIFKNFKKAKKEKKEYTYFSNIDYGYGHQPLKIIDLELKGVDFNHMITEQIPIIKKDPKHEGVDKFISDGGVYLPSHYDYLLDKAYKSLPIRFALSRQLYDENIHINSQSIKRIWLKLREQADHYFKLRGVINLPWFMVIKVRYYSEYESAERNILPYNPDTDIRNLGLGNKFDRALKNEFESVNGVVRDFNCIIRKKVIKYDTRAFHKKLFGMTFTDWKKWLEYERNPEDKKPLNFK